MRTLVVLSALLAATPAMAARNNNTLGVGVTTTLAGSSGLNVGKYLGDRFALELPLGARITSRFNLHTGLYAVQQLVGDEVAGIHFVGGFDIRLAQAQTTGNSGVVAPDFGVGVGLRGDWLPDPRVQFYAQVGVAAWYYGQSSAANGLGLPTDTVTASGFAVQLGPNNVLGTLGFTWWLGGK